MSRTQFKTSLAGVVVLAAAVPALICLGLGLPHLWPIPAALGVLLVLFTAISVDGHLLGHYLWRVWRSRRRGEIYQESSVPRTVSTSAGTVAYVWSATGPQVVACIEIAPTLSLPAVGDDQGVYTADTAPLQVLAKARRQFGLHLDISLISVGARVTGSIGALHNTVNPKFVSQRRTWVVVRLDLADSVNLAATSARGHLEQAAPSVVAAAVQRIAVDCRRSGVRAEVIDSAAALTDAQRFLGGGVAPQTWREQWAELVSDSGKSKTTARATRISGAVTTELIEQVWSYPALYTAICLQLVDVDAAAGGAGFGVEGSVVFFDGVSPSTEQMPAGVRVAYGEQADVFGGCLLQYGSPKPAPPNRAVGVGCTDDALAMAIGPSGQLFGLTSSGRLVGIQIVDTSRLAPKTTRVAVAADWFTVSQIALRAVEDGLAVRVRTGRTRQWEPMVGQLAHAGLQLDGAQPSQTAELAIIDLGADPRSAEAGEALSILTVYPSTAEALAAQADITVTQPDPSYPVITVDLHRPGFDAFDLQLFTPRAEQRYTGAFEPAALRSTPAVSTVPAASGVPAPGTTVQPTATPRRSPVAPAAVGVAPAGVVQPPVVGGVGVPTSALSGDRGGTGEQPEQASAVVPHARHSAEDKKAARAALERARERARAASENQRDD